MQKSQVALAVTQSLNARLVGRYHPLSRDVHGGQGIGKNKRGFYELETGPTFDAFEIITDIPKAESHKVTISIVLNNDEIFKLRGDEIQKYMRDYEKKAVDDGRFTIYYADKDKKTKDGIRSGQLVTLPTDRLLVYVDIGDVENEPSVRLRTQRSKSQKRRHFIKRVFKSSFNAVSAGQNFMMMERVGLGKFLTKMHLLSDKIARVNRWEGDSMVEELSLVDNNFDLGSYGKAPQAATFHYDKTALGFGVDGLVESLPNLKFEVVTTQANVGFEYIIEMYEQVAALPAIGAGA